jgi:hypothetical protein
LPSPVAVLVSDAHLQDRAWAHRQIEGDAYYSFGQVVDYAINNHLDIIGAGDLIDRRVNSSGPIHAMLAGLQKLWNNSRRFYHIQGQHEADPSPWFNLSHASIHVHKQSFQVGHIRVYGLDFTPADSLKAELDAIPPGTDLLVCHQVWDEFMGVHCGAQASFADVPVVSTVLTGDLHENRTLSARGKDGQRLTIHSLGSTCMQDIAEPPSKFFGVLRDDLSVRRVRLQTRPFIAAGLLLTEADVEAFLGRTEAELSRLATADTSLPPEIARPLVRVGYSHKLGDLSRRVHKVFGERAHLFLKEVPPERPKTVLRPEGAEEAVRTGAMTLEAALPSVLSEDDEPELYALALRVLGAPDKAAEVNAWVREALSDA